MHIINTDDEIFDFAYTLESFDENYLSNQDRTIIGINFDGDNNLSTFAAYAVGTIGKNSRTSDLIAGILIDSLRQAETNGNIEKIKSLEIQKSETLEAIAANGVSCYKIFTKILTNKDFGGNPWLVSEGKATNAVNQIFKTDNIGTDLGKSAMRACLESEHAPGFLRNNIEFFMEKVGKREINLSDFAMEKPKMTEEEYNNATGPRPKKWDTSSQEEVINEIRKEFQIAKLFDQELIEVSEINELWSQPSEVVDEFFAKNYKEEKTINVKNNPQQGAYINSPEFAQENISIDNRSALNTAIETLEEESQPSAQEVVVKESKSLISKILGCFR